MCRDNPKYLLKYLFGICMLISLVKSLKFVPKWSISSFQPILAAIFVTIATVIVKLIP